MRKFVSCRRKPSQQKTAWFIAIGKGMEEDRKPVFTVKHAKDSPVYFLDVSKNATH